MDNYRFLVATDMDYTLLVSGKPISDLNKAAIKAINEAGGAFTIATGRTSYLTGTYIRDLKINIPLITSNGAALLDPVTFRDIYSLDFDDKTCLSLLKLFEKYDADATGYSSKGMFYCPGSTRKGFVDSYNQGLADEIKAKYGFISYDQDITKLPKFNKFLIIKPDPRLEEEIRSLDGLEVVYSAKDFLDVMNKGASKGNALLKLASWLNIPLERTFGLGDSENDISLIEQAGHGIAMGQSKPEIKDKATYIAPTFEDDGFGRAIFDYVLPTIEEMSLS